MVCNISEDRGRPGGSVEVSKGGFGVGNNNYAVHRVLCREEACKGCLILALAILLIAALGEGHSGCAGLAAYSKVGILHHSACSIIHNTS